MGGGKIEVLGDLVKAGFLGRKSGKGIFIYDEHSSKGTGNRPVNPEALEIVKQRYSIAPIGANSPEDQIMRMVSRFINEAVLCLEEGILANCLEGDVGAVFGLGKLLLISFNCKASIRFYFRIPTILRRPIPIRRSLHCQQARQSNEQISGALRRALQTCPNSARHGEGSIEEVLQEVNHGGRGIAFIALKSLKYFYRIVESLLVNASLIL